jgi:integrase
MTRAARKASGAVVPVQGAAAPLSPSLLEDLGRAAQHAQHARASSTSRKYAGAWSAWESYAVAHGAHPLPAEPVVVAAYLAHLADEGLAPSSLDLALAGIADRHRAARLPSPTEDPAVARVRRGIRAQRGTRPTQKAAVSPEMLSAMLDPIPADSLIGLRDRALLLVGFGGALRRSELVALHVEHVAWHPEGIVLFVARSKTDQEAQGVEVPVHAAPGPLDPVTALRAWLDAAKIDAGPVFRAVDRWGHVAREALSDRAVALVLKRAAARVGLDAAELAGHSLRAGFATTAARQGASLPEIGQITRHVSERQIRRYIRAGTLWERDPLRGVLRGRK